MARSRCSICDDDLSTDRLCGDCQASPYNQDWVRESHRTIHVPLDHLPTDATADLYAKPVTRLPPRAREVLSLLRSNVTVRVRARGRARFRGDGWRTVTRPPHLSEIARSLRCSRQTVCRTLRAVEQLLIP